MRKRYLSFGWKVGYTYAIRKRKTRCWKTALQNNQNNMYILKPHIIKHLDLEVGDEIVMCEILCKRLWMYSIPPKKKIKGYFLGYFEYKETGKAKIIAIKEKSVIVEYSHYIHDNCEEIELPKAMIPDKWLQENYLFDLTRFELPGTVVYSLHEENKAPLARMYRLNK